MMPEPIALTLTPKAALAVLGVALLLFLVAAALTVVAVLLHRHPRRMKSEVAEPIEAKLERLVEALHGRDDRHAEQLANHERRIERLERR